jgi:hypothetical protein
MIRKTASILRNSALTAASCAALLALPSPARAQYYPAGGVGDRSYALERWDEDYSDLKDPAARKDFFDPVKYVPLNDSGDAYLSFGGQARYRYDYFNNYSFGPGTNDEDGFHLQRYLLHADAHLLPNLRAFVQVNAGFVDGRAGGPRYGDVDDFDLQQAFVDIKSTDDANPFMFLRLGRQELAYGAERYVSPDDWRNVRRTFEGGKFALSVPHDTLEVFWVRPVRIDQQEPNDGDDQTTFAGAYNVTELPDVIRGASTRLETYLFFLSQTPQSTPPNVPADADTYTLGARFVTRPGYWDFDVEANYQVGDFGSDDLGAWSVATEIGYTFQPVTLTPRLSAGLDAASGSADGTGRFNQLFPPTYTYLGHLYLFGRPNVIDAHVGVDLHLTDRITLFTAQHTYWRQNTNDGLFNLSGAQIRADNGTGASYIGTEFDIVLTWQIQRHVSAYLGYAHFWAGDFLADTGASKDADFLYASMTFTF